MVRLRTTMSLEFHFLRRLPGPRSLVQGFPGHQCSLGLGGVLPDSADGEAIQADFAGDRDVALMIEQIPDPRELFAAIGWLPPQIDAMTIGLRVGYTGLMGELRRLGLCLPERCHEADQRVPYRLFHRVGGGAVEGHVVDDGSDDDAAPHDCLDCVDHILVISSKAVQPPYDEHVASPEFVEQTPAAFALGETAGLHVVSLPGAAPSVAPDVPIPAPAKPADVPAPSREGGERIRDGCVAADRSAADCVGWAKR